MSLNVVEKLKKFKTTEFLMESEGHKGERDEICIEMNFLCLQCKSFIDTSLFQYWNQYWCCKSKHKNWEGHIPQKNWINLPKVTLDALDDLQVFCYRWKWGHKTGCEAMLQTCDQAKCIKMAFQLILSLGL